VFARTLGLPNDPVRAADLLARGLDSGEPRPIGLGRVNGRFFCFHTGIGYDAGVVKAVEQRASLKRWLGHPLFISAAITTWLRGYDRHHPHFRLDACDGRTIDDGYFTIVLNTNPYTYLGNRPIDLSPAATLDNPFVVVTFRTMRVWPILRGLSSALRGGGVRPSEHLVEWRDVNRLVVTHDEPFPYQLDGDYLGDVERLEFDFVPDAVRLVFPASAA
jgi:diacylglycerol kinase family enzyme